MKTRFPFPPLSSFFPPAPPSTDMVSYSYPTSPSSTPSPSQLRDASTPTPPIITVTSPMTATLTSLPGVPLPSQSSQSQKGVRTCTHACLLHTCVCVQSVAIMFRLYLWAFQYTHVHVSSLVHIIKCMWQFFVMLFTCTCIISLLQCMLALYPEKRAWEQG